MSKILTNFFSKKIGSSVKDEFSSNIYYFAVSRHSEWADENSPNTAINTNKEINNFQRELILGKRIKASDVATLIVRNFWTSGTVYTQYDDEDDELYSKEFYIINGSENVYKCLFNNNGAQSTVEPTHVDTITHELGDGYKWKYMYTLSTANNTKFSTTSFITIDANTSIESAAANGSIDIILISTAGSGYTGYISGSVAEVVSNSLFRIDSSSSLSPDSYYYNSSAFYITQGTGVGNLTSISTYTVNNAGHFVATKDPLTLDLTSIFRIAPQIQITGDGSGAKAVCTVNTISGSYFIESIDVLNSGNNYSYANVSFINNPLYGSGATARAILPPPGGHGADAATELGSKHLGISLFFNNNESSAISTDVPFRQGGIIFQPKKFTTPNTYFIFNGNTAVSNTNDTISITSANTYFKPGDEVTYVTQTGNTAIGGLSNNSNYFVVASNTTTVQLSTTFEGSTANLTSGISETGHLLYTTAIFSSNAFNALTQLNISGSSGSFLRNEYILGQTSGATAKIASANNAGSIIKVSTPTGTFTSSETILGNTSGVTATISSINNSDVRPFSSNLLYIDNVTTITRSDSAFEQAYLILTL